MNKLINIILSGLLWRKYKFLLVSLLITIVAIVLIGQIHNDYLRYAESTQNASVGWSFVIKWSAWIAVAMGFLLANHGYNQRKQAIADQQGSNTALQRLLKFKHKIKGDEQAAPDDEATRPPASPDKHDPFAHLRHKDKLRSYADIVIENKDKD
ncbi:hypothetical protein [Alteromonas facilis]|uniref:hypothetical protein n=1 Tax=Alteromonas facilis TaxID=2048004 RepID=UPI000C283552|nr:hypothetical protein [Alteromonas facilis]